MRVVFDAVVLAGGEARRFGGDKLAARIDGVSVLDRSLEATRGARLVVCVGPSRPTRRTVSWTREDPPGSGPVPGIAAGMALVGSASVLLLGGDMPAAAAGAHALLGAAAAERGSADRVFLAVSSDGRRQPLLALWPSDVLRQRLGDVLASPRRSVTALLDAVAVTDVLVDDEAVRDVDEPGDLPG